MRLIPVKGELNGHKFSVKPESLMARKVDAELKEDMKVWQEKNNADYLKWSKDNAEAIKNALADKDYDLFVDAPTSEDWKLDEEFRANRFKKMADACLKFDKEPPAELWKSDEIEYSTLEEAFDFFTGVRKARLEAI